MTENLNDTSIKKFIVNNIVSKLQSSISEDLQTKDVKILRKELNSISNKFSPLDDAICQYDVYNLTEQGKSEKDPSLIFDDTFKKYIHEYKKILLCLKVISRAKTFEERIVAEQYFLNKQTVEKTRKSLSSNSRYGIDEQEKIYVSSRTVKRKLTSLISNAMKDNVFCNLSTFEMLMLTPSDDELKFINKFIQKSTLYSKRTVYEKDIQSDQKKMIRKIQNNHKNVPSTVISNAYKREEVFHTGYIFDVSPFIATMNEFNKYTKQVINKSFFNERTRKIYYLRFIKKETTYKIADELWLSEKTIQRALSENSENFKKLKNVCEHDLIKEDIFYDSELDKNVIYETNVGTLKYIVFAFQNSIQLENTYLDIMTNNYNDYYDFIYNIS